MSTQDPHIRSGVLARLLVVDCVQGDDGIVNVCPLDELLISKITLECLKLLSDQE